MKNNNSLLIKNTKLLFDKTSDYKNLLIEKNNTVNTIQTLYLDMYNLILEIISCYNDNNLLLAKRNLINFDKKLTVLNKELNHNTKLINDLDYEINSLKICSIDTKKYKFILITKKKNLIKKRDDLSGNIKKLDFDKNKLINNISFSIAINFSNFEIKPITSKIPVFKIEGIRRKICNIRNHINKFNQKIKSIDSQLDNNTTCINNLEKDITLLYGNSCCQQWIWSKDDFEN